MAQQEISNPTIADSGAVHNSWSSIANDLWHGEIQKASTDVINNVSASGKAFASDPVGSLIDFTTPIGVVDHFAGTHIGTAISDVAAGEAKEVIDHPGTVAWDVGLGIGFGALTVATGGGFAVGLALGGAVIAGGELIKNKGNEVDGAINDANSVVDGVKSFGNDVSVVAGTGQHKQDEEAAAQQGLENAGAFVTQTVAFGVGAGIGAGLATSIAAVGDASAGATPSAIAAASAKPTLADIKPLDTTVPVNASQPVAANVLEVPTSPASQPVTSSVPEVSTSSASQAAGANLPVDAPNAVAQTPGDGATGTGNGAANPEGTGPKSPGDNAETKKPTTDSTVLEANTVKVMIGGAEVPVTAPPGVDVNAVVNSKPFGDWVKNLDPNIKIGANGIKIDAVKMFGKKPGFTLLTADATDATTDKPVPGIVFMRGNSVGVLPVLVGPDGSEYAAIVNQTRVPIGQTNFPEIPAGMMDSSGSPNGVAIAEVAQETGMKPTDANLIPLGKIYPSPGGSDEAIDLYAIRQPVTQAQLDQINGRIGGLAEENEQTRVQLVPLKDLSNSEDGKTLAAWAKYQALPREVKDAGTSAFDTGADG